MKREKLLLTTLISLFLFSNCSTDEVKKVQEKEVVSEEPKDETKEMVEDEMTESEDVSLELIANDLEPHPMQDIAKPAYLETITDPSFGTTIRRISDAGDGHIIKPMYSTVQAWNADESLMILYELVLS